MAGKLVLQVREGEWILIGSDIVITLERLQSTRTSISIEAPKDVKILRGTLGEKDRQSEQQDM